MTKLTRTRRQFLQQAAIATIGSIGSPNLLAQSRPAGSASASKRRIVMVTWRGRTDAERGFVDYWKTQNDAPDLIWHDAAQSPERLVEIAADIVRVQPDLVYAWGTPPSLGLAGSTNNPHLSIGKKIPLVFAIVADPVAAALTSRLVNHGRAITGVSHVAPIGKQLSAMRSYQEIRGVGIVYNKLEPNSVANVAAWQALGVKEGIRIVAESFPVTNNRLDAASTQNNIEMISRIAGTGANWLYLGPDSYLFTQLTSIAGAATDQGLSTFTAVESMLNGNAPVLTGLVSKFYQVGQFAAYKSQQVLRGERDVPIETLKRFSLVVRLDTAKQLGVYPPLSLIDQAEFRG